MQRALRHLSAARVARVARVTVLRALLVGAVVTPAGPADAQANAGAGADADSAKAKSTTDDGKAFLRTEERAPKPGTPLIANKLYPLQGRLELSALFDYSFNDKYVQHLGGQAAVAYHLFDWLAFEGFGGYLVGDETTIAGNVRRAGSSSKLARDACANATCEPQLPDMWQTTWFAGADVQWAPIYGKISAVSEYDLNFNLYLLGGAGAEGIQRALNGDANNDGVADDYSDSQVRVSANYGVGVRLMPWKFVALRAEVRNYTGLNPNVEEHNAQDEANCTTGYLVDDVAGDYCVPDISNNTMLQVGLSFIF